MGAVKKTAPLFYAPKKLSADLQFSQKSCANLALL